MSMLRGAARNQSWSIYRSGVTQDFGVGNAKKHEESDRVRGTSGMQMKMGLALHQPSCCVSVTVFRI